MGALHDPEPWRAPQLCIHCGRDADGQGDDVLLLCDCCSSDAVCLNCLRAASGAALRREDVELPSFQWLCGAECERVSRGLVEATGKKRAVGDSTEYTAELVRFSQGYRSSEQVVSNVIGLFGTAFGPARYADGSDMVDLVCKGDPGLPPEGQTEGGGGEEERPPDCSNFRVLVLRKGGAVVAAAAVRAHGSLLAEVPYVATRQDYRREGNCRRLMRALEGLLHGVGVRWVALPAVEATAGMWTRSFGFAAAGPEVAEVLEDRIVVPGGTRILLKQVEDPAGAAPRRRAGGRRAARGRRGGKRVRFELGSGSEEASGSSDEETGREDEYRTDVDEEEEEDEEEGEGGVTLRGCANCHATEADDWEEDEASGDLLCAPCAAHVHRTGRPRPAPAAPRRPAAAAAAAGGEGKSCYHCGTTEAARYIKHAESGGFECSACSRYRRDHDGQLCPPSVYQRRGRRGGAAVAATPVLPTATATATPTAAAAVQSQGLAAAAPATARARAPAARPAARPSRAATPCTPSAPPPPRRIKLRRSAALNRLAERKRLQLCAEAQAMDQELRALDCEDAVAGGVAELTLEAVGAVAGPQGCLVEGLRRSAEESAARAAAAEGELEAAQQALRAQAASAAAIAAEPADTRELLTARAALADAQRERAAAEAASADARATAARLAVQLAREQRSRAELERAHPQATEQDLALARAELAATRRALDTAQAATDAAQAARRDAVAAVRAAAASEQAALASGKAQLAEKNAQLAVAEATVTTVQSELAAKVASLGAAAAALASGGRQIAARDAALGEASERIKALQGQVGVLQAYVLQQQRRDAERQRQGDAAAAAAAAAAAEAARAQAQGVARAATVEAAQMKAQVAALTAELAQLRAPREERATQVSAAPPEDEEVPPAAASREREQSPSPPPSQGLLKRQRSAEPAGERGTQSTGVGRVPAGGAAGGAAGASSVKRATPRPSALRSSGNGVISSGADAPAYDDPSDGSAEEPAAAGLGLGGGLFAIFANTGCDDSGDSVIAGDNWRGATPPAPRATRAATAEADARPVGHTAGRRSSGSSPLQAGGDVLSLINRSQVSGVGPTQGGGDSVGAAAEAAGSDGEGGGTPASRGGAQRSPGGGSVEEAMAVAQAMAACLGDEASE